MGFGEEEGNARIVPGVQEEARRIADQAIRRMRQEQAVARIIKEFMAEFQRFLLSSEMDGSFVVSYPQKIVDAVENPDSVLKKE